MYIEIVPERCWTVPPHKNETSVIDNFSLSGNQNSMVKQARINFNQSIFYLLINGPTKMATMCKAQKVFIFSMGKLLVSNSQFIHLENEMICLNFIFLTNIS